MPNLVQICFSRYPTLQVRSVRTRLRGGLVVYICYVMLNVKLTCSENENVGMLISIRERRLISVGPRLHEYIGHECLIKKLARLPQHEPLAGRAVGVAAAMRHLHAPAAAARPGAQG